MKQLLLFLSLFLVSAASAQIEKVIPAAPVPPKLVVDLTGTLAPDQRDALERKLVAYDDSTSNQIAVVIVPTTGDYDISDYAFALGRKWGVGNKEFNNGVVFLIAKNDRKVFIAPGYGLEGAIPDITAKRIIENEVVPNFKANDFYRGIDYGTDALIKAAEGEYTAPAGYANRGQGGRPISLFGLIMVIVFIVIILNIIRRGGGGGGGGYMSRRGYRNWSGPVFFPPIGGGGWGGGSSGGGFGGGGFGGFGGGSFGGGGAGGSW